jgi:hypothetical protein
MIVGKNAIGDADRGEADDGDPASPALDVDLSGALRAGTGFGSPAAAEGPTTRSAARPIESGRLAWVKT